MKTKLNKLRELIRYWDETSIDPTDKIGDGSTEIVSDANDESKKTNIRLIDRVLTVHSERKLVHGMIKGFDALYYAAAVFVCLVLSSALIYMAFKLPAFGIADTPHNNEVYERYIEHAVDETGAVNAVAGMILDYRAFDTLGESHVLFTALMCVMILLKNTPNSTVTDPGEKLFDLRDDVPLRNTVRCVFPFVVMFGAYVLLAGHLGPGGGFSGGAILGAGMILLSCSYGDEKTGVFFNEKIFKAVSCTALCFYSLSKTYSFYTGANDLESIIPKGTPGAILSAGLILPLDIAVGLVVACTMFGFYSLFPKGKI